MKKLDKKQKRSAAEAVLCELWFSFLTDSSAHTSMYEEKRSGAADTQDMGWAEEMKKFQGLIAGLEKKVSPCAPCLSGLNSGVNGCLLAPNSDERRRHAQQKPHRSGRV